MNTTIYVYFLTHEMKPLSQNEIQQALNKQLSNYLLQSTELNYQNALIQKNQLVNHLRAGQLATSLHRQKVPHLILIRHKNGQYKLINNLELRNTSGNFHDFVLLMDEKIEEFKNILQTKFDATVYFLTAQLNVENSQSLTISQAPSFELVPL